ncbi:MAG: hypothetical protein NVSMB51_05350 [Solirubrobacteraceae bacterium]
MASHLRTDSVWSAQDTTPAAIEAALRRLLSERHAESSAYVPARVLNLICIVDREFSGEVANRLRQVGRYHASRTIICHVGKGGHGIDATASVVPPRERGSEVPLTLETVVLELGPEHMEHLDTVLDPLVVTDLATVVWAPHGHWDAVRALAGISQVVLLDSVHEPVVAEALRRARELSESRYIVDLAWLRSTPWRERIAAAFDAPTRREDLQRIKRVEVRHHAESGAAALLLVGWLASRLNWKLERLDEHGGGFAQGTLGDVAVLLEQVSQEVPGLAGVTLGLQDGGFLSLDRGPGGLSAVRRAGDGKEQRWRTVGASRGEGGILGEGIRQALLRDPIYAQALGAATAMLV